MVSHVIGLMSGTSVDGVDAVFVKLSGHKTDLQVELLAAETYPYPELLRSRILEVISGRPLCLAKLAQLDDRVANIFAQAALNIQPENITADLIGSHGQTVFHRPAFQDQHSLDPELLPTAESGSALGYSLQLGRGAVIAALTGIPTVSNFRAADIAAGGQGAPLVPCVDAYLLRHPTQRRCVQNIGGIGNVTYLPPYSESSREQGIDDVNSLEILGWDTGPGNTLLDLAVAELSGGEQTYDQEGAWAARGTPCLPLLEQWLAGDFFQQPPPKSTGREKFGPDYLQKCLQDMASYNLDPADILATLTELTAASIHQSYQRFLPQLPDQVLLCGGGHRNLYLRRRMEQLLDPIPVLTTTEVGLDADFKEAIAFAILAYWRQQEIPGNLPSVTGAKASVLLGELDIYPVKRTW